MHHYISRYVNALLDSSYPQVIHCFETILVDNTLFAMIVVMVYCCGEKWGIVGKVLKQVGFITNGKWKSGAKTSFFAKEKNGTQCFWASTNIQLMPKGAWRFPRNSGRNWKMARVSVRAWELAYRYIHWLAGKRNRRN